MNRAWIYIKEYGQDRRGPAPGTWRKGGGAPSREEDPTISQQNQRRIEAEVIRAQQAQRQQLVDRFRICVADGFMTWEEIPEYARYDEWFATAPAPKPMRYSSHVARRLSLKQERELRAKAQALERAREARAAEMARRRALYGQKRKQEREVRAGQERALSRLAARWGARLVLKG